MAKSESKRGKKLLKREERCNSEAYTENEKWQKNFTLLS